MATKLQAKTAIDNAATAIKADIDNILPVGVNIIDGKINFAPTRWSIQMDSGGVLATATSWRDTIQTNLTGAGRTFTTRSTLGRRVNPDTGRDDVRNVLIVTQLADYLITNF